MNFFERILVFQLFWRMSEVVSIRLRMIIMHFLKGVSKSKWVKIIIPLWQSGIIILYISLLLFFFLHFNISPLLGGVVNNLETLIPAPKETSRHAKEDNYQNACKEECIYTRLSLHVHLYFINLRVLIEYHQVPEYSSGNVAHWSDHTYVIHLILIIEIYLHLQCLCTQHIKWKALLFKAITEVTLWIDILGEMQLILCIVLEIVICTTLTQHIQYLDISWVNYLISHPGLTHQL